VTSIYLTINSVIINNAENETSLFLVSDLVPLDTRQLN